MYLGHVWSGRWQQPKPYHTLLHHACASPSVAASVIHRRPVSLQSVTGLFNYSHLSIRRPIPIQCRFVQLQLHRRTPHKLQDLFLYNHITARLSRSRYDPLCTCSSTVHQRPAHLQTGTDMFSYNSLHAFSVTTHTIHCGLVTYNTHNAPSSLLRQAVSS